MRRGHLKSFVPVASVGALALVAVGVRAATTMVTIQVTNETTLQRDPAVQGGRVAYTEFVGGSGDVWVYNLDTGTRVRAVTNSFSQSVEDLDGDFVVYGDDRNGPRLDIYSLDLATMTEHVVVAAPGNQTEPAISGNRVVWEQSNPDSPTDASNVDVYVGCVLGCSNTQLTSHPSVQFHPAISGDLVVWEDTRSGGGNGDIYSYWFSAPPAPYVAGETAIRTGSPLSRNPDVSGTRVVWDEEVNGASTKDIFLFDFATGVTTQITTDPADQTRPRISGNLIVWEDQRNAGTGNGTDLYGYDIATATEIAFVSGPKTEHVQDIDVRPDGGWDIAYTVDQGGGNSDIFVLRALVTADPTPTPTATATPVTTATPPAPTPAPTATPVTGSGDPCDPASGAPVYFVETFDRGHGQPTREERHFDAAAGPGTVCITLEHVSAAWVDFNDSELFGPSDFNPNATSARADVTLLDRNELGVKLAGAPCDDDGDDDGDSDDDGREKGSHAGRHGGGDNDDGDDRDDDGDDDDSGCARMTVRVVGPVPAPLGMAGLVEGIAAEEEAIPVEADGSASSAGCSVAPLSGASPLAGLALLGGLVLATRRRRRA